VAFAVEPPEAIPPVPPDWPPLPGTPPRDGVLPPVLPAVGSELLLLLEQANANSIAAGRMRRIELVLCMGTLLPI
jgi:hypothetical protein